MAEGPCDVWFYHLERTALDQALPELLDKTLARGWRALVRSASSERIEQLDDWLWSWRDDSFLAHGVAGEPHEARQPILLATGQANPNGAQAVFLLDGAEPGSLEGFARCMIMFDGRDEAAVKTARDRWRSLKTAGHPVSYWRQSGEGRWEKSA